MENMTIILGVVMFTVVVIGLVAIILAARSKLVSSGDVTITINDNPDQSIKVAAGGKLMNTLADAGIYLPSACGGGGSCVPLWLTGVRQKGRSSTGPRT